MNTTVQQYIKLLIVPAILVVLAVLFSVLIYTERELLMHSRQMATENNIERTYQIQTPFMIDTWLEYYGGGSGIDTVVAASDASLRVTTGGDGGWYGARTAIPPTDLTDTSLHFKVRFDEWEALDRYTILFASDTNEFQHYYGLNLKNFFADPIDDEWINVVVEPGEFEVIEGAPDWSHITDVAVRVVPKPAIATRVWLDELSYIKKKESEAIVSMTFDDGFESVFAAHEHMDAFDVAGTAYVIPEFIGTEGYMVQSQIDLLAEAGWDISGHGKTNLRTMDFGDVDADLAEMYAYLEKGEYKGREHFAYPNGGYSESSRSQVLEYFKTGRTIDGFAQPQNLVIPSSVNGVTIASSTPVAEIIDQIDTAIVEGSWLVLVWHDFVEGEPVKDVEYKMKDFTYVLDYLKQKSVRVAPFSEAYELMQIAE